MKKQTHSILYTDENAALRDPDNILEISGLRTRYATDKGPLLAVDGLELAIPKGRTVALAGESGCGKSAAALSLLGLLPANADVIGGSARFAATEGCVDLARLNGEQARALAGREIAMIFQEPRAALDPVYRIERQLGECLLLEQPGLSREELRRRCRELLEQVGIAEAERICRSYPHQLSGGQCQRVLIAMAISRHPRLLIADEPTTALDATVQARILALLRQLQRDTGLSVLLITHDLGVVAEMADTVALMYAGRVVEQGTAAEIFHSPAHPYTQGLLASRPLPRAGENGLYAIPGSVPDPIGLPDSCYFAPRCAGCGPCCAGAYPLPRQLSPTHSVACHLIPEDKQ